jgi:hypothetical protein
MGQNFIPDTVDQTLLFPPSLHDWLPEGHLARFLLDVISALDLNAIYTSYQEKDGRGQAAYAPEMMVRLLLYGYATWMVFGSDTEESACFSFSRGGSGCAPGLKRPLRRKRDGRTRLPRFWNCSVCIRLENPWPV